MNSRAVITCLICLVACSALSVPAYPIDFFFEPDTLAGNIGATVWLSGRIGPSELMRGYTVYMAYDTNVIDLAQAPEAGSLIAGRQGLQFNYFDHAPFAPDRLEVGATIFGTDFWQGPGEIFRLRFVLRSCGDEQVLAPFAPFFLAADGTFPAVIYHPALICICPERPAVVQALTIHPLGSNNLSLRWNTVRTTVLGEPLTGPVTYHVYRQQIVPSLLPPVVIASVGDTVYVDGFESGTSYNYHIVARTEP